MQLVHCYSLGRFHGSVFKRRVAGVPRRGDAYMNQPSRSSSSACCQGGRLGRNTIPLREVSWESSALSPRWGPCVTTVTLQDLRVCGRGEQDQRHSHERSALTLTTGHLLSGASSSRPAGQGGGRKQKTHADNLQKQSLANGIKKYQNISKIFKNSQAWQTQRAGAVLLSRELALGSQALTPALFLKTCNPGGQ